MIFFNAYGALRYWAAQIPAALIAALVFRFTYAEEEYESIDWEEQHDDKKAEIRREIINMRPAGGTQAGGRAAAG